MKTILLAAVGTFTVLGGVAGVAFAQDARPGPMPRPAIGMMADTNKDGVITKDEVLSGVDARFARIDTNRDGKIGADERKAAAEFARAERMKRRMARRGDADGDGAISLAEQRARAAAMFDRMDANKDGKIDQAERDAIHGPMKGMRGHGDRGHGMHHGDLPPPPPHVPEAK
jgi:hypothetical protein